MGIVGGLAEVKQARQLARCPAVVVATPGRLWALLQAGLSPPCPPRYLFACVSVSAYLAASLASGRARASALLSR